MSPEAQRIAIAEACGWYLRDVKANPDYRWCHPDYMAPHDSRPETKGVYGCKLPPDYLNDLNAMHGAEKVLTEGQRIEYVREIGFIWTGRNDRAIPNWWLVHDATAPHRAEAFLRAIGKWEDGK